MKKFILLAVTGGSCLFNVSCAPAPAPPPAPIVVKTYSYRGWPTTTTKPKKTTRPTTNYKGSGYYTSYPSRTYQSSAESFRAVTTPN